MTQPIIALDDCRNAPTALDIAGLLYRVSEMLCETDAHGALRAFCETLLPLRLGLSDADWHLSVHQRCLAHPVKDLFHECPLTKRAYDKPRGYAGDAEMLDMIYFQRVDRSICARAQSLFYAVSRFATGSSVAFRRDYMANQIDEIASIRKDASIFSLGCGHLRESERSTAVSDGRVARFVAGDQDPASLDHVNKTKGSSVIEPMLVSVKDLVAGRTFGTFDLIYSRGLFDYLQDGVASALVNRLAATLSPGGRLVIGNFTPDNYGRPYMETFMDWRLVLRSASNMTELSKTIARKGNSKTFLDPSAGVAYLQFEAQ